MNNLLRAPFLISLVLIQASPALADPALITNPHLPYPPGCAWIPDPPDYGLERLGVKFYDQEIQFYSAQLGDKTPLRLRAFRAPCSEPNRSLIWLEFILAAQYGNTDLEIQLPTVVGEVAPHHRKGMSLAVEPNGWGSGGWVDREGRILLSRQQATTWYYGRPPGERRWVFLLDNGPPFPEEYFENGLTPTEYNSAFKLVLRYNPYDFFSIDIPATRDLLPATRPPMPLSGRLSGNWVIAGTADQGVLLSVSELIPRAVFLAPFRDVRRMVMFLAHYTFDESGNMLWLTGAAEFDPGATEITIPIELVTNGEFRSTKRAEREVIGSVTLRSRSCNDLGFEYDYSGIGLGSERRQLQRLFSMETAGYNCRDYEDRLAATQ